MQINKKLIDLRSRLIDPNKPVWIILSLVFIGLTSWLSREKETPTTTQAPPSIDTYVPYGFVLVSLQLSNAESVDSMIGSHSLVDLYPTIDDQTSIRNTHEIQPIATHLRLIRAPNNPSLFGVLVNENQRSTIRALSNPVFAVIQGPNAKLPDRPKESAKLSKMPIQRQIKIGDLL